MGQPTPAPSGSKTTALMRGSAAASSVIGIAPSQGPPSGGPGVVPGPPTITKAVAGNAQVTLTWAAGSAGSNPIAGYVVVPYSGTVALSPVTFSGNPALSEGLDHATAVLSLICLVAHGFGP